MDRDSPASNFANNRPLHANRHLRVVCIGAGASGIYLAYRLKNSFTDFTLKVYEKNAGIGGTWWENRYPGCTAPIFFGQTQTR
jgi:cation diffusion facilitator CzcD-associated flavoprotein CzcO